MTTENNAEYRCLKPEEIGHAVETFRKMAGMKQLTLAAEAGVGERTVQRLENGEQVSDDILRRIAKAFRLEEDAFLGPREILGQEEAWRKTSERLKQSKIINAERFATLKDAEAVMGTHGMFIDDRLVLDEAAEQLANFKDLLRDCNDVYSSLPSAGQKLEARRCILSSVQNLESKGYVVLYGVYTSDDQFTVVTMLIARKTADKVKQFLVPSRFMPALSAANSTA